MAPAGALERLEELGPPDVVLLTNRHHYRDTGKIVERFGCTVRAASPGMQNFDEEQPVEPFDFGDSLLDDLATAHEVGGICPDETAIHFPSQRALALADGTIRYGDELTFVPDSYMDEPEQTKTTLKDAYGRLAEELDFDHLLLAHGSPVIGDGRERLRAFANLV